MMRKYWILILLLVAGWPLQAARVSVDARLDSMSMFIGNQNRLTLEITVPEESMVSLPVVPADTLVTNVFILQASLDSQRVDNGRKRYTQQWLLTCFDEGLYYIPPFTVDVDGEDYVSNYLSLKVLTFDVDTASKAIFDIKPVEKAPFVPSDYLRPVFMVWGGLSLAILAVMLILVFRRRRELERMETPDPELLLPPHVAALKALDTIREEKLWQQGRYKDFYTQLTDVLRKYIFRRYGIGALEMTSGEILEALRRDEESKEIRQMLAQILTLSDFVKFAKMNPLPDENDRALRDAYGFVEQTKREEAPVMSDETEDAPTGEDPAAAGVSGQSSTALASERKEAER